MIGLIWIYLRMGLSGFGGPFALIAILEEEFVNRRKWVLPERFQQALALIKVFPGATATQLAIYLARERAGTWAGLVCGAAFILPSVVLVLVLSYFYAQVHELPQARSLFQGMQAAALIVIADSVIRMGKPYQNNLQAWVIALLAGIVVFINPRLEPLLILGLGAIGAAGILKRRGAIALMAVSPAGLWATIGDGLAHTLRWIGLSEMVLKVSLICLKAGFLVFGTGLAIIPVLEADVVGKYHWLTHAQFLDGLAMGQITPGPVSTTATFIGYRVAGFQGALWATIAIFTSAFVNMLLILPKIERALRGSPRIKGFTDWAFPAVIGGIGATSLRLGISTITSPTLMAFAAVFGWAQYKLRPPAWAFIPVGGALIYGVSIALRG